LRNKYRLESSSAVKKDIQKLDKKLQEEIKQLHFPKIEQDPFQAHLLSHAFKGLWSYHISYKGGEYRIVYEIYPQDQLVLVVMIGPRQSFYDALKRRIR
jgi:addiction module RelE/StbE family toxin